MEVFRNIVFIPISYRIAQVYRICTNLNSNAIRVVFGKKMCQLHRGRSILWSYIEDYFFPIYNFKNVSNKSNRVD